jgi:hypothetical protein
LSNSAGVLSPPVPITHISYLGVEDETTRPQRLGLIATVGKVWRKGALCLTVIWLFVLYCRIGTPYLTRIVFALVSVPRPAYGNKRLLIPSLGLRTTPQLLSINLDMDSCYLLRTTYYYLDASSWTYHSNTSSNKRHGTSVRSASLEHEFP